MRRSFIIATFAAGASVAYRTFVKGYDGEEFGKNVVKTGGFLIILAILGLITPIQTLVDAISYVFVAIIALNDGYDIAKAIGEL